MGRKLAALGGRSHLLARPWVSQSHTHLCHHRRWNPSVAPADLVHAGNSIGFSTPLDSLFWLATANNVAALFGIAGIFAGQKEGVITFFVYMLAQVCVRKGASRCRDMLLQAPRSCRHHVCVGRGCSSTRAGLHAAGAQLRPLGNENPCLRKRGCVYRRL